MHRKCKNHPDKFCYICGQVVFRIHQRKLTDLLKETYELYFGIRLLHQDQPFAPHICCVTCQKNLLDWRNKKREKMPFAKPMIWRQGKDHSTDCYFCMTNLCGFNRKNKTYVRYPDVPSAIKPVPHGPTLPVPNLSFTPDSNVQSEVDDKTVSGLEFSTDDQDEPMTLTQGELNDLTRDLNLSKESAQLLGSRLREKRLLKPATTFSWYRHREREFTQFFSHDEKSSLVYCNNFAGLTEALGVTYSAMEWRLFIDSSNRSLKAVLLNNGNKLSCIPVGHSVAMKESYCTMKCLLALLNYDEHKWLICGDLKVVGLILGLQSGYTKFPCFMCLWDSRADNLHYVRSKWPTRKGLKPGSHNVLSPPLVDSSKILLPPLHIKLGLMKNFV